MSDEPFNIKVVQKSGMGSKANQNVKVELHVPVRTHQHLATIRAGNLTFNPGKLRDVIQSIDAGLSEFHIDGQVSFSPGVCMVKKNELNNFDQEYFDDVVIEDFYPQFLSVDRFLNLRVNEPIKAQVDRIILSLNRRIKGLKSNQLFFQELLFEICDALIDKEKESLEEKEEQVLLVLYYFYCNCCIGKKTLEEKDAGT